MLNFTEQEYCYLWRRRNKVTLKILANYVGCSQSLISRWECGLVQMSDEKVRLYKQFVEIYKIR